MTYTAPTSLIPNFVLQDVENQSVALPEMGTYENISSRCLWIRFHNSMRNALRLHNKGTTKTLGFTFTIRTIKEMVC